MLRLVSIPKVAGLFALKRKLPVPQKGSKTLEYLWSMRLDKRFVIDGGV